MLLLVMAAFPAAAEAGATIPADDIRSRVSLHVERNHPWPSGRVRIQVLSKLSDTVFPQESVTFEVTHDVNEDFIGDAFLGVKYYAGRNLVKEETVRVGIEVLTDVVVSKRELAKNREITPDDVQVQQKWLKRIPGNVVTELSEVIGKIPAFNVRPNCEIARNSIRVPLMIKRGNVVRIVFDSDDFNITTVGISEEDGAIDKVIKVRNMSSNKTIYARVTGNSLVKVEF
jgi:flagella basal body P-ring formation protein FlgA